MTNLSETAGDFRRARGVIPWQPGDEPAENTIRRLRDAPERAERAEAERDEALARAERAEAELTETRRQICLHWAAGALTEGQASRLLGMDRLRARDISLALGIKPFDGAVTQNNLLPGVPPMGRRTLEIAARKASDNGYMIEDEEQP